MEGVVQLEGGWDAPGPGRNSASCAICLEEGRETAEKEVENKRCLEGGGAERRHTRG